MEEKSRDVRVRQEVQQRYLAELMRYKQQIEKNRELLEKGKTR
jgi:hypothetical protein